MSKRRDKRIARYQRNQRAKKERQERKAFEDGVVKDWRNAAGIAKGQQCTAMMHGICNRDDSKTVAAHIQLAGQGKMGGKTFDLHVAWLCSACHDAVDGRTHKDLDKDFVRLHAYEAVLRTQSRLFAMLTDDERAKLGEATR